MDFLRHPRRLSVLSLVAVASLTLLAATPAAVAYEGYGYPTVGGQAGRRTTSPTPLAARPMGRSAGL